MKSSLYLSWGMCLPWEYERMKRWRFYQRCRGIILFLFSRSNSSSSTVVVLWLLSFKCGSLESRRRIANHAQCFYFDDAYYSFLRIVCSFNTQEGFCEECEMWNHKRSFRRSLARAPFCFYARSKLFFSSVLFSFSFLIKCFGNSREPYRSWRISWIASCVYNDNLLSAVLYCCGLLYCTFLYNELW